MTTAPGMAAAHPERLNERVTHKLVTIEEAAKIIAAVLTRDDFAPNARQLIADGAELEYKIIVRERKDGNGLSICLDKYIRTAPVQICYFGGLR